MSGDAQAAAMYLVDDGSASVVPGSVSAWLHSHTNLGRLRGEVRGDDPERDAVLLALAIVGKKWVGSANGTNSVTWAEIAAHSKVMTTDDVAAALDVTTRAVVKAIHDGRLRAERVGRSWLIRRADFEQYKAARAA